MSKRGENLAQAAFPEMEEARAALRGLEGLDSELSEARRAYEGPRDPEALLAYLGYEGFRYANTLSQKSRRAAAKSSLAEGVFGKLAW